MLLNLMERGGVACCAIETETLKGQKHSFIENTGRKNADNDSIYKYLPTFSYSSEKYLIAGRKNDSGHTLYVLRMRTKPARGANQTVFMAGTPFNDL
jgi:hypothetical protein